MCTEMQQRHVQMPSECLEESNVLHIEWYVNMQALIPSLRIKKKKNTYHTVLIITTNLHLQ